MFYFPSIVELIQWSILHVHEGIFFICIYVNQEIYIFSSLYFVCIVTCLGIFFFYHVCFYLIFFILLLYTHYISE